METLPNGKSSTSIYFADEVSLEDKNNCDELPFRCFAIRIPNQQPIQDKSTKQRDFASA